METFDMNATPVAKGSDWTTLKRQTFSADTVANVETVTVVGSPRGWEKQVEFKFKNGQAKYLTLDTLKAKVLEIGTVLDIHQCSVKVLKNIRTDRISFRVDVNM